MIIWLARLCALCFLYRLIEPLFPSLKKSKVGEFINALTDPIHAFILGWVKDILPIKESQISLWVNIIGIFAILILGRIIDFII